MRIDFKNTDEARRWQTTDDVVMGGVSHSTFSIDEKGTGIFRGNVSLENGGGFSSVRIDLLPGKLAGFQGLSCKVKGDGKIYKIYLKVRLSRERVNFQCTFGTSDQEWDTLLFEFDDFMPVVKGKPMQADYALDPEEITAVGFLISNKQSGPFELKIKSIEATKPEE